MTCLRSQRPQYAILTPLLSAAFRHGHYIQNRLLRSRALPSAPLGLVLEEDGSILFCCLGWREDAPHTLTGQWQHVDGFDGAPA